MRATQRYEQVVISGLAHVDAPQVVTSTEIEDQMATTLERLGVEPGLLEGLSGIRERRVWGAGTLPSEVAAQAGELALADSGVDRHDVGALLNTSVCRDYLEPSTASLVHGRMELPTEAVNFDVGNACLGFVNGMNVVASMIEHGEIDHGLVVDGETSRFTMEATIKRLASQACDEVMFREQFATLTLGSGAVAMVLSRADSAESGRRFLGGMSRASTAHANLCTGHVHEMRTDTKGLLLAGLELAAHTWKEAVSSFDWDPQAVDTYVVHQVSKVHTRAVCDTLGLDIDRFPLIYPEFGNIGPAGVPTVLSRSVQDGTVSSGDRVMLMGVGSGINAAAAEIIW
jgi:3-oxoacyl-[acyl-carrier-protein] synthase III